MNPGLGFYEEKPLREWAYPLFFSLILHLLIFLAAVLPSTFSSPCYDLKPIYSVRLVDAPLPAKHIIQPKSAGVENEIKDIEIKTERKKMVRERISPEETLQYEKKLKTLALKREAKEKERQEREEQLKAALGALRKQSIQQNSAEIKKSLAGIREKISQEGVAIEARTPIAGDSRSAEASFLNIYLAEVWDKIRSNWVIPPYLLKDKGLETIVVVRIGKSGAMESTWLEKKSGNVYFDQSAIRAVRLSIPFSPLPPEIKESVLELGVRFHPSDRG